MFDRSTGQRLQPFDFCALAFERHGYIAKETAALIRKLATLKANAFELDPSEEIRKWYTVLSCCVQRANAKVLREDATPGQLICSTAPSLRQSRPCSLRVVIASVYRFSSSTSASRDLWKQQTFFLQFSTLAFPDFEDV